MFKVYYADRTKTKGYDWASVNQSHLIVGSGRQTWMKLKHPEVAAKHLELHIGTEGEGNNAEQMLYVNSLFPRWGTFIRSPDAEEFQKLEEDMKFKVESGSTLKLGGEVKLFVVHEKQENAQHIKKAFHEWINEIGGKMPRR